MAKVTHNLAHGLNKRVKSPDNLANLNIKYEITIYIDILTTTKVDLLNN